MFLQRLLEYAGHLELPPTLYAEAPVRYIIELDRAGSLLNRQPTDTADLASRALRRGERRRVPQVQRASATRPLLLADNSEYTLGLAKDEGKEERARERHRAYLDQVRHCAAATEEAAVEAVRIFLERGPLAQLQLPADWDPAATITFRVEGAFPVDLPAVQAFWAAVNDPSADPRSPAPVMQCIVCGQRRPALRRLQTKIKGLPGAQGFGASLISANAPAFLSYGLQESLIAPTCARCGELFAAGLSDLLADRGHHLITGGVAFVFWTRQNTPFDLANLLRDPSPDEVRQLLTAARRGLRPGDPDHDAFYAAALTVNGGRIAVRDWIDTTVAEAKRRLRAWFRGQSLVGAYGEAPQPLSLYALAASTVRDVRKDLAPGVPRALWRSAITGTPLPPSLLDEAVRRSRAEQRITRPRAALIKLALCSRLPEGPERERMEDVMTQLDLANVAPAYLCGRLLAVIERVQRLAVPGIKATVVSRFFGTASSAPASVFGRLLRGAQPHLSKLERDRPGAHRALQSRLEEILAGLPTFPRVLTLEEQGLFALGYYHQRACDRAGAREARARQQAAADGLALLTEAEITSDSEGEE